MSNPSREQLYEQWYEANIEATIICPYCGDPNQLDPPMVCCGEIHAEEALLDSNGEIIAESELNKAFEKWLETHGE